MDYKEFTPIAQQVLKSASQRAKDELFAQIENGLILHSILAIDKNVTPFILNTLGIDVKVLTSQLEKLLLALPKRAPEKELSISDPVEHSLNLAKKISKDLKDEYISIEHILYGILVSGDQTAQLLASGGLDKNKLNAAIRQLRAGLQTKEETVKQHEWLSKFAQDMNRMVTEGKIEPIIGRSDEIRRLLQIISRKQKNNPIIIGEPGVGKTALVEGFVQRLVKGDIPENLKHCKVFSLDMGSLIAGASKQGEFEDRLKNVIREVQQSNGEIILFIDEIHLLVGAGKGAGAMDAANILKPELARGNLRVIGATTINEYKKYFEQDKALVRRFQTILLAEPSVDESISILRGIKEKFELHHKVSIRDEAVISAVELSHRYITESFLPDKAIDLMDEAAAKLRIEMNSVPAVIDEAERNIMQLRIEKEAIKKEGDAKKVEEIRRKIEVISDERTRLRAIWESEKAIVAQIIAEKNTIEQLKAEAKLAEGEANFEKVAEIQYEKLVEAQKRLENLRTQINGSGAPSIFKEHVDRNFIAEMVADATGIPVNQMMKDEMQRLLSLEEELARRVIGQNEAIRAIAESIRRSRTGLNDPNKPIGSFIFLGTSGVGKTELAKALAELLFGDERAMVRLDMSEYMEQNAVARLYGAPPGYVGYEEGGQLTEAVRRKPYCVLLLDEIEKAHPEVFNTMLQVLDDGRMTDSKGVTVNFKNTIIIMTSNAGSDKILERFKQMTKDNAAETMMAAKDDVSKVLREKMRPEFLNRIDEIIMFLPLSYPIIKQITELQLKSLVRKLGKNEINLWASPAAHVWIARMSFNPAFGARPVKRTIQRYLLNEVSEAILKGEISRDKTIVVDEAQGKLTFRNTNNTELEKIKAEATKFSEKPLSEAENKVEKTSENTPNATDAPWWKRFWRWISLSD